MVSVDWEQYQKDFEASWIWKLFEFFGEHWISIIVSAMILMLAKAIFDNIVFPAYYENIKKWYGFEETLILMKKVLEENYDDLWHESEFCLAYLKLQDDHQKLIRFSKSDANGENPKRFHWSNKYSKIKI